jgi:hypothetical protein
VPEHGGNSEGERVKAGATATNNGNSILGPGDCRLSPAAEKSRRGKEWG